MMIEMTRVSRLLSVRNFYTLGKNYYPLYIFENWNNYVVEYVVAVGSVLQILGLVAGLFCKSTWPKTDCGRGNRRRRQMNPTRLDFEGPSRLKSTSPSRLPGLIATKGLDTT